MSDTDDLVRATETFFIPGKMQVREGTIHRRSSSIVAGREHLFTPLHGPDVEPDPNPTVAVDVDGFDDLTVEQLKEQLTARELPVTGNKPELVARLREAAGDQE